MNSKVVVNNSHRAEIEQKLNHNSAISRKQIGGAVTKRLSLITISETCIDFFEC